MYVPSYTRCNCNVLYADNVNSPGLPTLTYDTLCYLISTNVATQHDLVNMLAFYAASS